jgi:hypothetical protein
MIHGIIKKLGHAHAINDKRNIVAQKQRRDKPRLVFEKKADNLGRECLFCQLHLKLKPINAIEGNLQT